MSKRIEETTFNFWPSFSDVVISVLFIVILFFFILVFKVYEQDIINVKQTRKEVMQQLKRALGQDSIIIQQDVLSGNNHTIIFKESFLFDQGQVEFRNPRSAAFVETIARELKKFVQLGKITRIVVEGHTNSDKIKNDDYGNWRLSALRAVTVVKILDSAGIAEAFMTNDKRPSRMLSVTGFSQYDYVPDGNFEDKDASKRIQISLEYRTNNAKER